MIKKIKIAIYSGTVPSTTFIERLITGMAGQGFEVLLFGVQNKKVSAIENTHYITHTNRVSKLLLFLKYSLLLYLFKAKDKKQLDAIISKKNKNTRFLQSKYYPVLYHQPDIFHLQWAKGLEDWMWVQEFGMKLLLSLRGTHVSISPIANDHWHELYSHYFSRMDGFHAVSESMISIAQKFEVHSKKVKVVRSGIDLNKLHFRPKTAVKDSLNILSVGRSHWVKGYSYALDAMKILKNSNIDFNYTIIGVEENEELLYQRVSLALEKEVTFLKSLPFQEVVESMQKADVLLLSSVEEGIANVVLEAMALGTIVISTNCGGMGEVIIDKENGFLVPIRDSEAMAEALKSVLELPANDYQEIRSKARATIENQYSDEHMVVGMKDLYLKVLNNEL